MEIAEEHTINVQKGGEGYISTTIRRDDGIKITVRAHPRVEAFFRSIAPKADPIPVGLIGRSWLPVTPLKGEAEAPPLLVYDDGGTFKGKNIVGTENSHGRLDIPGQPLGDLASGYLNLSFMRLVGISEGAGVSFMLSGVYRYDKLQEIRDEIGRLQHSFIRQYIRPVRLDLTISTQELEL